MSIEDGGRPKMRWPRTDRFWEFAFPTARLFKGSLTKGAVYSAENEARTSRFVIY